MDEYSEFLQRANFKPSRGIQKWLAKRILRIAFSKSGLNPKTSSVVEIGSGVGLYANVLKDLNVKRYLAVEPNRVLAEYCRSTFHVEVIEESLPNLTSIKDESADFSFSINVLEHSETPSAAIDWIKEILRITKVGGFSLIVCPDIRDYGSYFWDSDWTHSFPTSPSRLRQICKGLNLEIIQLGCLHFGSLSKFYSIIAWIFRILLPTRLIDYLSFRLVERNLGSGLNFTFFMV